MGVLSAVSLLFALMGAAAFASPRTLLARLELPATTPTARNEVQAVYGGFGLAVAVVLLLPLWRPELRAGVAITVGAALAGMAAGRGIALLRERPNGWALLFLAIEAIAAAALFAAA
ncbi:DUF4345 family protein [Solimonas variicoloris]|uniref:DUF4345 family protein n=1 Tax=Solimonas variicoloris TaxID=254408 RepID=UPI0003A07162|nr:DUF4345 family protein [Solimonas variicoloris]